MIFFGEAGLRRAVEQFMRHTIANGTTRTLPIARSNWRKAPAKQTAEFSAENVWVACCGTTIAMRED
jgi:hypothetical protein